MRNGIKYLRLTIHDNYFLSSLQSVCKALQEVFYIEGYPDEEDLPKIKEYIKHMWYGADAIHNLLRWKDFVCAEHHVTQMEYLDPELSLVNFEDILEWDNCESAYIPMMDGEEILVR